ncbi:MAG TPA: hypothetical protein VGZ32_17690, partial [Actinocrinis sp.]|nr:hypothetical protein [Actinocrinis sp.]
AAKNNPKDWQTWWWVCLGGEAVFIPFIFMMTGYWRPRRAREEIAEHERYVAQELSALGMTSTPAAPEAAPDPETDPGPAAPSEA